MGRLRVLTLGVVGPAGLGGRGVGGWAHIMERKVGSGLVGSWSVVSWAVRGQWGVSADGRDWWATHERTVVRPSVCRWPSVSFGRRDRALTTMTTDGRPDGRNPCRFVWSILLRWLRGRLSWGLFLIKQIRAARPRLARLTMFSWGLLSSTIIKSGNFQSCNIPEHFPSNCQVLILHW